VIYLACPYSHPDPAVRQERFREACRVAAAMIRTGEVVFSPVIHNHPLVEHGLPSDWEFWDRFDRVCLERCDEIVVLMLDGWEASVGVQAELAITRGLGKPVRFLAPEFLQWVAYSLTGSD
jgi:hypothetical protein